MYFAGNSEAVYALVNAQNVNSIDDSGKTALHFAATYDLDDIAKILIKHGANVNAIDRELNTPLHLAAKHGFVHIYISF